MRHIILSAVLLVCGLATAGAATRSDSIRARFLNPDDREVLVAVHRGDWRGYAENSLEGIESAVNMGADIVEVDLRRTADGELVLMHDPKVDRTTTGKGAVSDLTLAELRKLRLRNGVMGRTPYTIPTLRELLTAQKGRVLINLDKAFDYFDQVMELLEETGTTSQIIMKSDAPAAEVRERYGKYLDRVIYMPIIRLDRADALDMLRDHLEILRPAAIELSYADSANAHIPYVGPMCKGKARVWSNTLWASLCGGRDDFASLRDPAEGYGFLVDSLGCSIIQTDQPRYLMDWLSDRELKPWHPDRATLARFRRQSRKDKNKSDWAKFGRYARANRELTQAPAVVFMGNSITDAWARKRPEFFTSRNMAGRGISGQTTSQMLVRFRADVIDLHPKAVVILAGINDIALNNGLISVEHIAGNIQSMCELARVAGITPVICSVLPASVIPWRREVEPAPLVMALNSLLRDYAQKAGIDYVDYHSAMKNAADGLDKADSADGVHPTAAGYEKMETLLLPHISKYLKQ